MRIQWLKEFMARAPAFHDLQPQGDDKGRFLLAKPGEYYLLYCPDRRSQTLTLAGHRPYKVDAVDPWEMTITPVGTAPSGAFAVSSPKPDLVFRFTPYQPGEKVRPDAEPATRDATQPRSRPSRDRGWSSFRTSRRWTSSRWEQARARRKAQRPG